MKIAERNDGRTKKYREPTHKQLMILKYIEKMIQSFRQPTFKEIGIHFGIDAAGIFQQCESLRDKGYLTWESGKARTFRIIKMD